jgi:hypothetical protein
LGSGEKGTARTGNVPSQDTRPVKTKTSTTKVCSQLHWEKTDGKKGSPNKQHTVVIAKYKDWELMTKYEVGILRVLL